MATTIKDFTAQLRSLGLKVVKSIEKGVSDTRKGIESTILEDELHRRFNLENPYRFEVRDPNAKPSPLAGWIARNAKRYDEDDLFVFYGGPERTGLEAGQIVKDLADGAEYVILNVVAVAIGVTYKDQTHDVPATAVQCKAL
jgi:hypothetical protein